jgi:Lectin C-type domain
VGGLDCLRGKCRFPNGGTGCDKGGYDDNGLCGPPGKCYYGRCMCNFLVAEEMKTWNDSATSAPSGCVVASIANAQEQTSVESFVRTFGGGGAWIGGRLVNDENVANGWQWADGQPFGPYSNWDRGEPNNSGGIETRLNVQRDGRWNDAPPSTNLPAVYKCCGEKAP